MGQDNPLQPGDPNYDPAWRPASPLTRRQAEALTEKIRQSAETTWALLTEAHEKKAWARLGYASWEQYVHTEFGMSRSRSYQLLDQGWVIHELEAAAGLEVSTKVDTAPILAVVTDHTARDLKPILPEVVEKVKEAVKGRSPKARPAIVAEVVAEERAKVKAAPAGTGKAEVEVALNHLLSTLRTVAPDSFTPAGWRAIFPVLRDKVPAIVGRQLAALEEMTK